MAFAQVAATNTSTEPTAVTSHDVSLPTGIAAGNLLLVYFAYNGGTATGAITWPSGWSEYRPPDNNAANHGLAYAYRIANGTEAATIIVTTAATAKSAHYTERITGAHASAPVVAGVSTGGTTANPNPPSLNFFDSEDLLWEVVVAYDLSTVSGITVSAYPTSYANGVNVTVPATDGVGLGVARRELQASSEDPGTFTLSASEQVVCNLVAVRPSTITAAFTADVLPKLLTEIRSNADVIAIAGANPTASPARVRGFEPAAGDAQGGTPEAPYRAFVVLVQLDAPRLRRVPVQRARIAARCYGRTPAEAAALRWAVSHSIHEIGERVHATGLGFWQSSDDEGGEQDKDPNTQQPLQTLFINVLATTQVAA